LLSEINNARDAAHENFRYCERRPLATILSLREVLISPAACWVLHT